MMDPPPEYPGLGPEPTAPLEESPNEVMGNEKRKKEERQENVITNQNQLKSINGDTEGSKYTNNTGGDASYSPPIHGPSHHTNNNWYCCFCISCGDSGDSNNHHHQSNCGTCGDCGGGCADCCDGCCSCSCCDTCCEDCDCGDCNCGDCDCGGGDCGSCDC